MNQRNRTARWTGVLLVLAGAASYGFVSPITKLAYGAGWDARQVSASMIFWGALVMWAIVALRRKSWSNPFKGAWIRVSLTGILGLALTTVFINESLSYLNASLSIVLLFQFAWITMLIEAIWNRKRPSIVQLAAVAIILIGTVLTVGIGLNAARGAGLKGLAFGLLSAVTYSMFIVMIGRVRTGMDSTMSSAVMLAAALAFVLVWAPVGSWQPFGHPGLTGWGLLLGLLGPVFPTLAFNLGIPRVGGTLAGILGSVELPVAVVAAYAILGENVGLWQWAGIAAILIGMVMAERQQS